MPNTDFIYLVSFAVYDPDLPGAKTLYFTSGLGKTTEPGETPANTFFEPRILNPINFTRTAFSDARVMGGAQIGYGEIVLNNFDQGLSSFLDYGMDGREVLVEVGEQDAAYPSGYVTFFTGTMDPPELTTEKATIRLRDKLALLDVPIQTNKYAGTNSGGSGKEGTADDIKGNPKPLTYGRCYHVPLVLVNDAKLIYQFHDGSAQSVDNVYYSAVPLLFGTDRANLAAMEASAPLAGYYDTCLAEGLIRLGATPAGVVTATVQGDNTGGYASTVGAIIQKILQTKASIDVSTISTTSVSTLDAAAPYEVGIFIPDEQNIQSVIDSLLSSVGAWLIPDRNGDWTLQQLVSPSSSTAAVVLTDLEITKLELQSVRDENKGIPVYRVLLEYHKNWHEFAESDIAGVISDTTKIQLLKPHLMATATDTSVQTKHLLAPELTRTTILNDVADAAAEATRVLTLHKVRRDFLQVEIRLDSANALLDIGSIVEIQTDRLGYTAGRKFVVVGITSDGASNKMTLDLWG